jgi:hypothetical protein
MLSFYYWSYITLSDYYSSLQCPFLNSGIVVKCVLKNNFKFCPKTPTSCHRIVLLHQELVNIEKQEWKLILVSRKKKLATFFPITVCCSTNLVWRSTTNLWNTVAKEWRTEWLAKQNGSYGHTIKIHGQWFIRVNWSCNVIWSSWQTKNDTPTKTLLFSLVLTIHKFIKHLTTVTQCLWDSLALSFFRCVCRSCWSVFSVLTSFLLSGIIVWAIFVAPYYALWLFMVI